MKQKIKPAFKALGQIIHILIIKLEDKDYKPEGLPTKTRLFY